MRPENAGSIVKPENCVMAFGIPLDEASFKQLLRRNEASPTSPKSYASNFKGASFCEKWWNYESQVTNIFDEVEPAITRTGAAIRKEVTLQDFGKLFEPGEYRAITLFTHWDDETDQVEFSDGFAGASAIIEKIPGSFDGIIDLCVCHPICLVEAIRRQRPNCLICFRDVKAVPAFWLSFYRVLYKYLRRGKMTFPQAIEDVISEFLEQERDVEQTRGWTRGHKEDMKEDMKEAGDE